MEIFIVLVFVIGYLAITLEHSLKIDKLVPALLMMALAWAGVAFGLDGFTGWFDSHLSQMLDGTNGTLDFAAAGHEDRLHTLEGTLLHHFGKTCEILIFLVGAMTIVEIIDHFLCTYGLSWWQISPHQGRAYNRIRSRIHINRKC